MVSIDKAVEADGLILEMPSWTEQLSAMTPLRPAYL